MKLAEHVARMADMRNAYRNVVKKSEEKRPLGKLGRRWEDNIKVNLK
jgi:hypothetical protein